ncbi:DUF4158 domain-containing protein [Microtetraspora sp. NBRC 16547]|uniref:DUF4158 domain-containing protein n=1 Tax=Microtetraspora sp. NBRC 16547 TaxID=3030993 RepID=UPI00332FB358
MVEGFLSDGEAARYGRFCGAPSRAELEKVFFLDDADRRLVKRCRGPHNRLAGAKRGWSEPTRGSGRCRARRPGRSRRWWRAVGLRLRGNICPRLTLGRPCIVSA